MKSNKFSFYLILFGCLAGFFCLSCDSRDRLIGTYTATLLNESKDMENRIDLKENGEGAWKCCEGEFEFSWYIKENELRINTKEGGIMIGKLKNNAFTITLPGNKKLVFTKIPL